MIERLRDRVAASAEAVLREVKKHLQTTTTRADRLRLLGLGIACCRNLGRLELGSEFAGHALSLLPSCRSAVAVADVCLQLASFRIVQRDQAGARDALEKALETVETELQRTRGSAKGSRQRRTWFEDWAAVCLVVRGDLALHLGEDEHSSTQAFRDGMEALRLTGDIARASRNKRRAHLGAVTLLCALVDFGPVDVMRDLLRLLDQAEKVLIYRVKARPGHMHRIRLRWCRALVLARLGATRPAENLLTGILETLVEVSPAFLAPEALNALCWVIERSGQVNRAAFVRRRWQDRCHQGRLQAS